MDLLLAALWFLRRWDAKSLDCLLLLSSLSGRFFCFLLFYDRLRYPSLASSRIFIGEKNSPMYTLDMIKLQHPTMNPYTTFA